MLRMKLKSLQKSGVKSLAAVSWVRGGGWWGRRVSVQVDGMQASRGGGHGRIGLRGRRIC